MFAMSSRMAKGEELATRITRFAGSIVQISAKLPPSIQGRHIAAQILRSGTATAANYAEAGGAESRADFIHKLRIVQKELNETEVWLGLIRQTQMISPEITDQIIRENRELCKIIGASLRTLRSSPS